MDSLRASRKPLKASVRNELLSRKTCANCPTNQAPGCKGYICPMWVINGGNFDEAGWEIDHIIEVTHGGTNDILNLQLLCPNCHSVKTKRCSKQKWDFNSIEIDSGMSYMETERPSKRKRSNSN